jgi:hypothetical protein
MNRLVFIIYLALAVSVQAGTHGRWTKERAAAWYDGQPFLAGANFSPSTAGTARTAGSILNWNKKQPLPK